LIKKNKEGKRRIIEIVKEAKCNREGIIREQKEFE
jgi:hypothetical protein